MSFLVIINIFCGEFIFKEELWWNFCGEFQFIPKKNNFHCIFYFKKNDVISKFAPFWLQKPHKTGCHRWISLSSKLLFGNISLDKSSRILPQILKNIIKATWNITFFNFHKNHNFSSHKMQCEVNKFYSWVLWQGKLSRSCMKIIRNAK